MPRSSKACCRSTAAVFLTVIAGPVLRAQPPAGYYDSVDASNGAALRSTLHDAIDDHSRFPYTAASIDTWDIVNLADEDPNNSANVVDLYRNASYAKIPGGVGVYNREHVWPKSYGFPNDGSGNYPFTDCHHLFAADGSFNSSRSNKPFRVCSAGCDERTTLFTDGRGGGSGVYPGSSNWTTGSFTQGSWETWSGRKGDVARAILYMDIRYEGGNHGGTGAAEPDLIATDSELLIDASNTGSNEAVGYMGMLSVLLQWHRQDPVDQREIWRNEVVFSFQGNRNPFIDHPEWVECLHNGACGAGGGSGELFLSEVLYDVSGSDDGLEWVELYNAGSDPADLSQLCIGNGGSDYTASTVQLSGTLAADGTFLVGGPTSNAANGNPVFDQVANPSPDFQNSGSIADGVALFNLPCTLVTASTVPIDAVLYGGTNSNGLVDETGAANAPEVGDAPSGSSIERIDLSGSWQIRGTPTPGSTPLSSSSSPPTVTIAVPSSGSSFPVGTAIAFAGSANDAEDGDLTGSLSWSSSRDGEIGSGGVFTTSALTAGVHAIAASVSDSDGLPGSDQITLTLTIDTPPPPPPGGCLHEATFESGASGWTQGADSCTTGSFVVGSPTEVVNGGVTTQAAGGAGGSVNAFFTAPNTAAGTNDVDGGTCEALSPSVNASGESAVEVVVSTFHGQRDAADDATDGFTLEVLNNGTVVDTLVDIGDVTSDALWTEVSTTVVNPGTIQLRVRATDGAGGGDLIEAGIDNVTICPAGTPPPPPPPSPPGGCTVDHDFESGAAGWANDAASTCTTGGFVVGTPTEQVSGGVTTQVGGASSGVNALFTATNTAAGTNDVDGGNCILTSPTFAVAPPSTLSVAYFHGQRDADDDAGGDFAILEVSTNGGATFSPLVSIGDATSNAAWTTATTQLPAASNVVFRLQCSDGAGPGDLVECGMDDFSICSTLPTTSSGS